MQNPDSIQKMLCRALDRANKASSDFDLNPEISLQDDRPLKPAAVLIAVTEDANLVLTKRSAHLKNHPGQIAFAGGRKDESDPDLASAALREANEEIGLDRGCAKILGELPNHDTVTNYKVTPIVAMIPAGLSFVPEPGEVAEVFCVPLAHVMRLENYRIEGRRWRGQMRYYYTVPYGPHYIWGATARILRSLAEGAA